MRCRRRNIHGEMPMVGSTPIIAKEALWRKVQTGRGKCSCRGGGESYYAFQSCANNTTVIRHPKGLCEVARLHDCNADSLGFRSAGFNDSPTLLLK